MSNPDFPRPQEPDPYWGERSGSGYGESPPRRSYGGNDRAGRSGGASRGGYDRGSSGSRGGRGYGSDRPDGYGGRGRGTGRGDYPGSGRRGDAYGGGGNGGRGNGGGGNGGGGDWRDWQRHEERSRDASRLGRGRPRDREAGSQRAGPGQRGRQDWQGRGGQDGWGGRSATALRERRQAGAGMGPGGRYPAGGRAPGVAGWLQSVGDRVRGMSGGFGRGGGGPKVPGSWWRHWTWKKAITLLVASGGGMVMLLAIGAYAAYARTPIPNVQAAALASSSTVYFSDGKTVVGRFGSTNRQVLLYNQIPPLVRNAVVAAEDKNFYHEGGISPTGILRAAYYDITSSGSSLQGASTITQQLVRNYYDNIGTSQTVSRKIKEIFVAQKLSRAESKAWILQEYLNTVYFGNGAWGVQAAAETYFGVPVTKLSPAQSAMIAAMIQSPSYYSPHPKAGAAYQALVFRWKYVLGAMVKMGTITPQAEAKALKHFPRVVKPVNNSWGGYRGYIMQAVQRELETTYHLSGSQIANGGLKITTTVSQHMMNSLYASVNQQKALMRADTPPGGAVVGCRHSCLPKYVHVGAMLEQPGTGAILAWYGGPGYNQQQYDDALQSRNQVGSSFKPYVLATAVKQGMNVQHSTLNGYAPLWIPPDNQPMTFASVHKPVDSASWYKVTNDEIVNSQGPVSVLKATAESLNSAFTDLWHRVAFNESTSQYSVVNMAKDLGVNVGDYPNGSNLNHDRDYAGTALGQASLTVEEQATMIATLAAGGEYSTPHVIKDYVNTTGQHQAQTIHRQVLTSQQAADVDYAMEFDTASFGTAPGLGLTNGQQIIAKTGTTNLSQQAFFLGATQRDAMAVGMFVTNGGCTLPKSEQGLCTTTGALSYQPPPGLQTLFGVGGLAGYGGQWPAQIWHSFFLSQFNTLPVEQWPPPNDWGSPWNLVGKLPPKPKPKPTPSKFPNPLPTCQNQFQRHCQHVPPSQFPSPTPSPGSTQCGPLSPPPCPTPSAQAAFERSGSSGRPASTGMSGTTAAMVTGSAGSAAPPGGITTLAAVQPAAEPPGRMPIGTG